MEARIAEHERPSPEEKAQRDIELRDAIERIVLQFPGYGYRRVTKELHRRGWAVNHKRVLRVMRQEALVCQIEAPLQTHHQLLSPIEEVSEPDRRAAA